MATSAKTIRIVGTSVLALMLAGCLGNREARVKETTAEIIAAGVSGVPEVSFSTKDTIPTQVSAHATNCGLATLKAKGVVPDWCIPKK